ncbi:hypothetical protein PTTG_02460 [Puccinia triticina 1-1 BBBD Race 1]|uniref:Uncharacterized protein n=1 Tax=Puccinia triticina (isolate 1-1 / race 1 (BBBD)) TaxID=630390 RepID=A0A180H2F7_PUCT1|nr:hypothetical protein PTTG_02460 [Puccinia triticina 1-1 BBBD Race 1]
MAAGPTADDFFHLKGEIQQLKGLLNNANLLRPNQQAPPDGGNSVIQSFHKKPLDLHYMHNPKKTQLAKGKANFKVWDCEINRTLKYVFENAGVFTAQEANFKAQLAEDQAAIACLLRSTIETPLLDIVNRNNSEDPWNIFKSLKDQCDQSDRQHKLDLINQFTDLMANQSQPGTNSYLAKWSKVWAKMSQLKILFKEMGGLCLQNSFAAPIGIDSKTFEFVVSQKLEAAAAVDLNDVMTVIQVATGKSQHKSSAVANKSHAPMDLDAINAMRTNPGRYAPPHRQHSQQPMQNRNSNLMVYQHKFQEPNCQLKKLQHTKEFRSTAPLPENGVSNATTASRTGKWVFNKDPQYSV